MTTSIKKCKYIVGHPAYNGANAARLHTNLKSVYRDLRARGADVESASRVVEQIRSGQHATLYANSDVIEAQRLRHIVIRPLH